MSGRMVRIVTAVVLGVTYVGLLGYSVLGTQQTQPEGDDLEQTRPPKVLHHDSDVDVYQRRNVRAGNQRGGGIRGGK